MIVAMDWLRARGDLICHAYGEDIWYGHLMMKKAKASWSALKEERLPHGQRTRFGDVALEMEFGTIKWDDKNDRVFCRNFDEDEDGYLVGVRDGATGIEQGIKKAFPSGAWSNKNGEDTTWLWCYAHCTRKIAEKGGVLLMKNGVFSRWSEEATNKTKVPTDIRQARAHVMKKTQHIPKGINKWKALYGDLLSAVGQAESKDKQDCLWDLLMDKMVACDMERETRKEKNRKQKTENSKTKKKNEKRVTRNQNRETRNQK
jgi:hypothetical protein